MNKSKEKEKPKINADIRTMFLAGVPKLLNKTQPAAKVKEEKIEAEQEEKSKNKKRKAEEA